MKPLVTVDEPAPKPEVPRRVLDDRCEHGFLEQLCYNARCRNFSGRRNAYREPVAAPQFSGVTTPKPEGRAARAGSDDRQSPAPKDPAADSAHRFPNREGEARAASTCLTAVDPERRVPVLAAVTRGPTHSGERSGPRRSGTAGAFLPVQLSLPLPSVWLDPPPLSRELMVHAAPVRITRIVTVVCAVFGVSHAQMWSKDRHRTIASARSIAMAVARECTDLSYPELGRVFGNRDHTTVMSACKLVARGPRNDLEAARWGLVRETLRLPDQARPPAKVRVLVEQAAEIA